MYDIYINIDMYIGSEYVYNTTSGVFYKVFFIFYIHFHNEKI